MLLLCVSRQLMVLAMQYTCTNVVRFVPRTVPACCCSAFVVVVVVCRCCCFFDGVVVWVTQADGTFTLVLVRCWLCRGLGAVLAHVTSVPWFAVGATRVHTLTPFFCGWGIARLARHSWLARLHAGVRLFSPVLQPMVRGRGRAVCASRTTAALCVCACLRVRACVQVRERRFVCVFCACVCPCVSYFDSARSETSRLQTLFDLVRLTCLSGLRRMHCVC